MTINKKIILVPHCFTTKGFTPQYRKNMSEVLQVLLNSETGIIQMPCPHLILMQEKRRHKNLVNSNDIEYDYNKLQDLNCLYLKHLSSYLMQIDEYKKQGFEIAGLIGVRKSPTCALKNIKKESQNSQGVFMDILKQQLEDRNIHACMANIDIPLVNQDNRK